MRAPHRLATYVVTAAMAGRDHLDVARAAIAGGATTVQLRAPELGPDERARIAADLAAICRTAGVLAIVNDDVDAALTSGADGVHVGQDADAAAVRDRIGRDRILGVSVGSPAEAASAASAGADYLGVTVWPTPTKPEARPAGPEGVAAVAAATELPIVGIGGIDAGNAGEVIAAGATGVAVISAVAAAEDPIAATRAIADAVGRAMTERREERR